MRFVTPDGAVMVVDDSEALRGPISELKARYIAPVAGVPPEWLSLRIGVMTLNDGHTLWDYDVENGGCVQLRYRD